MQPVELLRLLKLLHDQIGYLEVVTNGHAGNWSTIGCQGVLATLATLPVFRDMDRFTAYFIKTLATQVEEQILLDGVQDELTPHYHAVVVNNILTCAESVNELGLSLEQRTLDTLHKMVRYQEQTVVPDRSAQVAFNNGDPEAVPNVADRLRKVGLDEYVPPVDTLGPEPFPTLGSRSSDSEQQSAICTWHLTADPLGEAISTKTNSDSGCTPMGTTSWLILDDICMIGRRSLSSPIL